MDILFLNGHIAAAVSSRNHSYGFLRTTCQYSVGFRILFSTFFTYLLIPIGQQRIRPTLVSMYSYVQPIIATAISIGMDTLSWQKVVAAITVFTGVFIVSYSRGASHTQK